MAPTSAAPESVDAPTTARVAAMSFEQSVQSVAPSAQDAKSAPVLTYTEPRAATGVATTSVGHVPSPSGGDHDAVVAVLFAGHAAPASAPFAFAPTKRAPHVPESSVPGTPASLFGSALLAPTATAGFQPTAGGHPLSALVAVFVSDGDEPGENAGLLIGNGADGGPGQDGGRGGLLMGNGGRGGDGLAGQPGGNGGDAGSSVSAAGAATAETHPVQATSPRVPVATAGTAACCPVRVAMAALAESLTQTTGLRSPSPAETAALQVFSATAAGAVRAARRPVSMALPSAAAAVTAEQPSSVTVAMVASAEPG
jgi:hypothetical protein